MSATSDPVVLEMAGIYKCPICSRPMKKPRGWKPLCGVRVCAKCRNGFANRRQFAYMVDAFAYWGVALLLLTGLRALFAEVDVGVTPAPAGPAAPNMLLMTFLGLGSPLGFIAVWIMPLLFYLKDGLGGASLGKRLCGLQVIDVESREPISFAASFKRNIVLLIPVVGFWGCVITMMNGQRWGDRFAGTMVVWKKHRHRVPFDQRGVFCFKCGYDLTGNITGRCPECGTATGAAPVAIPVEEPQPV